MNSIKTPVSDAIARLEADCARAEYEYPLLAAPDGNVAVSFTDLRAALDALRTPKEPIEVERDIVSMSEAMLEVVTSYYDEMTDNDASELGARFYDRLASLSVNNLSVERAYREGWRDGLLRENGIEMIEDDWKDSDTFASLQSSSDSGVEP